MCVCVVCVCACVFVSGVCVCVVCVCVLEDVADMRVARLKTPPLTVIWLLARTLDCFHVCTITTRISCDGE